MSHFLESVSVRRGMPLDAHDVAVMLLDVDRVLVLQLPCSGPLLGPATSWPLLICVDTFQFYMASSIHNLP